MDFVKRISGEYLLGDNNFIPMPLPPKNPEVEIKGDILELYGDAMLKLGRLNEMVHRIPDKDRFLKAYILKESILTSDIEGIHTTILEVLSLPYGSSVNDKNTQLVVNYSYALEHAISMIKNQNFPIVARVLKEAHAKLLLGKGDHSAPGDFRKQQVKVGSLLPAPATHIPALISDLERFINTDNSLPPLIKAGLAHVQFETIHPFLDGNGRIGRLLIVVMLIKDGLLSEPLLYPSYFFKKYHAEYYARLDAVRTRGDFEGWLKYYLQAISESAEDATTNAHKIEGLEDEMVRTIQASSLFARSMKDAIELLDYLFKNPVISITEVSEKLNRPYNSVKAMVRKFEELGVLTQHLHAKRNRIYTFSRYIDLLG